MLYVFIAVLVSLPVRSGADAVQNLPVEIESALTSVAALCSSEMRGQDLDLADLSTVAAFIVSAPDMVSYTPNERFNAKGSFLAYTLERPLSDVLRYIYNHRIPAGAVNPSSIHYGQWKKMPGGDNVLPQAWIGRAAAEQPQVARGMMRETISPDLHTGAYYEYDLHRTFLMFHRGTTRVIVSLSEQAGDSEVGRKGFIVGDDSDWNYLYTPEQGLDVTGLGWVKSKIQTFKSLCFYIEDELRPGAVRIGVFQWLGAGWIGVNMVDSHHIRNGMRRYAEQFKGMLESERMPDAGKLEGIYTALTNVPEETLRDSAMEVTRHIKRMALHDTRLKGKSAIQKLNEHHYVAQMDKDEVISILMREYVKYCLGMKTPLSADFWLALKGPASGQPLS
jgi:hypothetical protein